MRNVLGSCLVLVLLTLSGCTSIRTSVTAFSVLGPSDTRQRIAVLPWRERMKDSLEFKTYVTQVETHLRAKGFTVVSLQERPELIAFLDFGIDDGTQVAEAYTIPQYGVTGYSSAFTTGTITSYGSGFGTYQGTTTYTPQYGVTGYSTGVRTRTEYSRFVNFDIVRPGQGENTKVYESKLRSRGSCGNLPTVMPPMLTALFRDFPASGGRTINVRLESRC